MNDPPPDREPPLLPATPCSFDQEFLDDLPYDPEVLLFDELLELDPERNLVRARMTPQLPLPLTSSQRVDPVLHPRHLAGGLLVHATAVLGFAHAYYLLGLRHRAGWTGYGTHIHRAVFRRLVPPGTPVEATGIATRIRSGETRQIVRYSFEMRSEGKRCYEGDQSAMWLRVDRSKPGDASTPPGAARH